MEITLKITKKRILAGVAVLAAAGVLTGFMAQRGLTGSTGSSSKSSSATASTIKTVTLEKRDLMSSIAATGIIYSREATNVYSGLNYTVTEIAVSAGNKVQAGDVLARLDSSSLESEIAQKEASAGSSYAKAQLSLSEAQRDLDNYKRDTAEGYDTGVTNAQTSIVNAEIEVTNSELDLESAQLELQNARRNLRDARNGEGEYAAEEATDTKIDSLKTAVTQKENAVDKATSNLEKAKLNLENAKKGLTSAQVSSDDTLATYQDKVKSAQLSLNMNDQWLAIENLKKDIEKCVITAPVSGTVTAVNAVTGASGSGLLFVIQDESSLKIITEIKEYDVGNVGVGDRALITTEATGDEQFEGVISKIAPTTTLTASGESATSTDAQFESEITVKSTGGKLRIGMNASLSIVLDERKGVLAVPFEAVVTEKEDAYVFAAELQQDETYAAKKIPVTQGLETDVYVEVSGDGLSEGMIIVKSATGITEGQKLDIAAAAAGGRAGAAAGGDSASGSAASGRPEGGMMMGGMSGGMGAPPAGGPMGG